MKIGIKYCGGCNSRYDRTKEVHAFIKRFPNHTYIYNAEEEICDICLLVCGCMTGCASSEGIAAMRFISLCTPQQFAAFTATFSSEEATPAKHQKRVLHLGDTASMSKTFAASDVQTFAKLTGDYGKLHTDSAFAAQYGFGKPVVHGVLTGSLLSSIMGMTLPGDGTILMDEAIHFTVPVYAGDTITATVTLQSITEQKRWYIGELKGTCTNQDGTVVAEGTFHQMMMKTLFIVKNNE